MEGLITARIATLFYCFTGTDNIAYFITSKSLFCKNSVLCIQVVLGPSFRTVKSLTPAIQELLTQHPLWSYSKRKGRAMISQDPYNRYLTNPTTNLHNTDNAVPNLNLIFNIPAR